MKTLVALALVAVTSTAFAQMGPPPGGPGGRGGMTPPSGSQNSKRNSSNRASQNQAAPTETIRLLGMRAVQTELGMTATQYGALVNVTRSLGTTTSEEVAYAATTKVLTPAQAPRLRELLIQDLGYNARDAPGGGERNVAKREAAGASTDLRDLQQRRFDRKEPRVRVPQLSGAHPALRSDLSHLSRLGPLCG